MRHKPLGRTGLFVSELCLGTMTFGGSTGIWAQIGDLQQADAERLIGQAIDAGLAYVTEDRKALGLNLLDSIKVSITSAGLKKIKKGLAVDDNLEVLAAERFRTSLNIKTPDVEEGVSRLSGGARVGHRTR